MDKNNYYNFKTQLENPLGEKVWVTSREGLRMDKNSYYYTLKT